MVKRNKKNPGWFRVEKQEGIKRITCQSKSQKSPIFFSNDQTPEGNAIFAALQKPFENFFEILHDESSLKQPSKEQEETILLYFKQKCWTENGRFRRISKLRSTRKPKAQTTPPMYKYIWLAYSKYNFSYKMLQQAYKITARTVKTVVEAYNSNKIPHEVLDQQQVPRCGRKRKYSEESKIVDFVKAQADTELFKKGCTIKKMTQILNAEFPTVGEFKESKVHQLMRTAGIRYRRVKLKLVPRKNQNNLIESQYQHTKALSKLIYENKLIIFVDETYVNSHLIPKKMFFGENQDPTVVRFPKDQRASIIAATSLNGIEALQLVFGSVDSICYTIFVLTIREQLIRKYPGREAIFIYDNARPHIYQLAAEALNGFPFVTQPPYFPQANFIEYIFGLFKRSYRKNKLHEVPGVSLLQNVLNAFSSINRRQFDYARLDMYDNLLKILTSKKT